MNEQDLIRQLKNHKYAIDQSSIVAATDLNGTITYVNDKFCEVSGYSREELLGADHALVNSQYHPPSFFSDLWLTIKQGKVWRGDIRNRSKTGQHYWVSTTIVPFRDNDGNIFQFLSIRHEITGLKMAQQLILEQQARLAVTSKYSALGEMAANLTHEINNPLAAILGRCEMMIQQLQRGSISQKTILSGIESIEFTARRIEKIVRSMRSFSVAGDGDPFEQVSVGHLINETIDFVQQRFKDYRINLLIKSIPQDLVLECRSTEISQVLLNLFNNAFDAIVNIVLKGTYNCTLAFGKHWIENKNKAVVLNIVTTYAWTGSAFVVPSAAAKAGVLAITRSLAVEWAKYGIRFNAIAPGLFPTKGAWERLLPGDLQEKLDAIKKIPLKRVGEHQELANLAAYLISDFSSFINGEVITIDGGEWLNGAGQFNLLQAVSSGQWDDIEKMVRGVKGS